MFAIQKLKLYCDSESAFLKGENLTGGNKQKYPFWNQKKAEKCRNHMIYLFPAIEGIIAIYLAISNLE